MYKYIYIYIHTHNHHEERRHEISVKCLEFLTFAMCCRSYFQAELRDHPRQELLTCHWLFACLGMHTRSCDRLYEPPRANRRRHCRGQGHRIQSIPLVSYYSAGRSLPPQQKQAGASKHSPRQLMSDPCLKAAPSRWARRQPPPRVPWRRPPDERPERAEWGPGTGQAAAGGRPTPSNPSVLRSLPEPKWDLARRSWASTWAPPTPQWRPWRTLNLKAHEVTEAVLPRGRRTHHHPQRGGRTDHAQRCGLFQER